MTLIDLILDYYEEHEQWNIEKQKNSSYKINEVEDYKKVGKRELIQQALDLQNIKLVKIEWINGSYVNEDIAKVKYALDDIGQLYQLANREPIYVTSAMQKKKAEELYQQFRTPWIRSYMEQEIIPLLNKGKKIKNEEKQEMLYKCLEGIDKLEYPVFKKIFSKHILNNSKKFEKEFQKTIVRIAKKYSDELDDNMEEQDILNQLFIEEYSQELYIKGKLLLELEGDIIDTSNFRYGTIINTQTMKNAVVLENPHIHRILTIENKANFIAEPYEKNTLIIFTHGYLSPVERRFLIAIDEKLHNQVEYYLHSGDMDYGGVCIFRYIRKRIFPKIQPYKMDAETYHNYERYAEEMSAETIDKLRVIEEPLLQDVIKCILETGKIIEQEAYL